MSHACLIVAVNGHKREIEKLVSQQMAPFDENGQFFRDGSRWDWWVIGGRYKGHLSGKDFVQRKDYSPELNRAHLAERASEAWDDYHSQDDRSDFWRDLNGIKKDDTKEQYIARQSVNDVSAYGFLRNHRWYERARLGWFGGEAKTECELAGDKDKSSKCIVGKINEPPCIICWNEDTDKWCSNYFSRFIANLDPETWLVTVDFHV